MKRINREQLDRHDYLFERYADQQIDESETDELDAVLRGDEHTIRRFVDFMRLHGHLQRVLATPPPFIDLTASKDWRSGFQSDVAPPQPSSRFARRGKWGRRLAIGVAVLAAMLLLTVSIVPISDWLPNSVAINRPYTPRTTNPFVAKIVKRIDCEIEANRWTNQLSNELFHDQTIELRKGLLVIEFNCGALVTLEGPAQFQIIDRDKGFLTQGRLSAVVDERAVGFRIETPVSELVDLGTEFGISVDPSGTTEAHVFKGEVHVFKKAPAASPSDLDLAKPAPLIEKPVATLTENQASRISTGSIKEPTGIVASPQAFVRMPTSVYVESEQSIVPWSESQQLVLWFDAEKNVQVDEKFRVVSWGDHLGNGNFEPQDFWQVDKEQRPFWVVNSDINRKAIRFMALEHLISEPLKTGNQFSVFLVASPKPQKLRPGQSSGLLDFGTYRNFSLFHDFNDQLIARMNFRWENGVRNDGTVLAAPHLGLQPAVLAYTYDQSGNQALLMVNSGVVATGEAPVSAETDSSRLLGTLPGAKVGFVGDVFELLIFDSALTEQQASDVSQWLMQKYAIETE